MTAKNATASGFINTKVKAVRSQVDDKKMHLEIELYHPQLVMESMYKGQGNLNELRYNSKGFVNTTLSKLMNFIIEVKIGEIGHK